jgi:hypothetical protein
VRFALGTTLADRGDGGALRGESPRDRHSDLAHEEDLAGYEPRWIGR